MGTILYIDDDPEALELYSDILSERYKVETCSEPEKCLSILEEQSFDAVLLDVNMPGLDGFRLLEKIRKLKNGSEIPVFFISSENTMENRIKAFGLGSEDFIDRYMEPQEILMRINSRLSRAPSAQKLSFGDIEVDLANLLVKCCDEVIELTQTEYRIIYLLIRESLKEPRAILDRDSIISFVWPNDAANVFPRTLSTHMTNLRKKLNSQKVKINSVRQTGFQLELV